MITPEDIARQARRKYSDYLKRWIAGEDAEFFPCRIRGNFDLPENDLPKAQAAVDRLRNGSKSSKGWGYRVDWVRRPRHVYGDNEVPKAIWIDTREDLLYLCDAREAFERTGEVATLLRGRLPGLEDWMRRNVGKLATIHDRVEALVEATEFLLMHPVPGCFVRELPLTADTKFVLRNAGILSQWWDILLPPSAIDVTESSFARRYGFRDGSEHVAIHFLDDSVREQLGMPFRELSLDRSDLATLAIRDCEVVIVENRTNLLTLPPVRRGIGVEGKGNAVTLCRHLPWLADCRVYYWGDLDAPGLEILSTLRRELGMPVRSLMMDVETMRRMSDLLIARPPHIRAVPTHLEPEEQAAYEWICRDQVWLEQERIPQAVVREYLARIGGPS